MVRNLLLLWIVIIFELYFFAKTTIFYQSVNRQFSSSKRLLKDFEFFFSHWKDDGRKMRIEHLVVIFLAFESIYFSKLRAGFFLLAESCSWQVYVKNCCGSELFLFHFELWVDNTNPQRRHTCFAVSKISFSEKLYITQKSPMNVLKRMGSTEFHRSVCCFKSFSGVIDFVIFIGISTAPKKIIAIRLIFIGTGFKFDIFSGNKLS